MKIFVRVGKHEFEFEWIDANGESYLARDGKKLDAELLPMGDGRYSLILDNMPYMINLSEQEDGYQVRVVGESYRVVVDDERTRKVNELVKAAGGRHGEKVIKAPIPGLVVKVPLRIGDSVEEGGALLILEAMKMENIIKAPYACEVLQINVQEKDTVKQNQELLRIKGIQTE